HDLSGCVAISADGSMVASANRTALRVWSLGSGKEKGKVTIKDCIPDSVAFSPDGSTVTATDNNGKASVWETRTNELLHSLPGLPDQEWVSYPGLSADGKVLAVLARNVMGSTARVSQGQDSPNYLVHLFEATTGKEFPPCRIFEKGYLSLAL